MNNQIEIEPLVDAGYVQKTIANGQNAVFKNGRLVYIILDVDKPGKYFFDLRDVFNASTGESGKDLKILFMNNNVPFDMNGKTVSIAGIYPNRVPFHVTGAQNQASSSLIDFVFPLGLFQQAGIYKFQFQITDESQNQATSHYCFFQVTQNSTLMAVDYNNGVNPFDSDYTEWKNKVEQEVNALTDKLNNLNTSADQLEQLMNNYIAKAQQYVDAAWQKKLDTENTWTAKQHFNGGITFGNNAQGDTLIANEVDTQRIIYQIPELADYGYDLESGVIVHTGSLVASSTTDSTSGVSLLNGVGTNNSGFGYITFDLFKGRDYNGVCIHANCKIPQSAVGKPIVQLPGSLGLDQTPFRLGDYVVHFDMTSNVLFCLGHMNNSNQGNDICQDVVTIL